MLPTTADVAGSVCLLDTTISCAKMAKPIKMPFGGGSGLRWAEETIRYGTRCYFNVCSKANMSQLNLPHRIDN